jgi:hypothetical protein
VTQFTKLDKFLLEAISKFITMNKLSEDFFISIGLVQCVILLCFNFALRGAHVIFCNMKAIDMKGKK